MKLERKSEMQLLERLRRDAESIGAAFALAFRSLRKTRRDARIYGCCDTDGNIRIRLRSRITGDYLKYSSLVATVCHELAHLRHFDHGMEFTALYRRLLQFAREAGVYQPGSPRLRTPPIIDRAIRPALAASAAPRRRRRGSVRGARRGG